MPGAGRGGSWEARPIVQGFTERRPRVPGQGFTGCDAGGPQSEGIITSHFPIPASPPRRRWQVAGCCWSRHRQSRAGRPVRARLRRCWRHRRTLSFRLRPHRELGVLRPRPNPRSNSRTSSCSRWSTSAGGFGRTAIRSAPWEAAGRARPLHDVPAPRPAARARAPVRRSAVRHTPAPESRRPRHPPRLKPVAMHADDFQALQPSPTSPLAAVPRRSSPAHRRNVPQIRAPPRGGRRAVADSHRRR